MVGTGCMTVNPTTLHKELRTWVPIGTTLDDAKRIMIKHGFKCEVENHGSTDPSGNPALVCRRENRFMNRFWIVALHLADGRVSGYDQGIVADSFRIAPSNP
jgi:hypothetical protein